MIEDKRRAVMTLLSDDEWVKWNDVRIANSAGVSSMFVGKLRKELSLNGLMMPDSRLFERNGNTSVMNTANEYAKPWTPSERVAIAEALRAEIGNGQGQRTDTALLQNIAEVEPGKTTRDIVAEKAGFGNAETYGG